MTYVPPITDRTQADILAKNSKAYQNVSDWVRQYDNSEEAHDAIEAALGVLIDFDTISAVVNTDIPTIAEINEFLANIERLRLWVETYAPIDDSDFIEVKDDWLAGQSNPAPTYMHVNSWEKVVDLIYQIYKAPYSVERVPIGGIATCGAGLTNQNWFRG